MYYLRARWYRPDTGRFLTQDTYEGEGQTPKSLHAYLYGQSDPVQHADPSGNAVVIGYGVQTRTTGTGSGLAGPTIAMAGVCGLAPVVSNFANLNSPSPGVIVAPCSLLASPGPNLPPPGDCTWARFLVLNAAVVSACHAQQVFKCLPTDSKFDCAGKAIAIGFCMVARTVREATCFRGGDQGHRDQITQLATMLGGCWTQWSRAR